MTAHAHQRISIVGAGQAGARAAEALRAAGHRGTVTLIGAEAHLPYERPQLSKKLLLDDEPRAEFIKQSADWAKLEIELELGAEVIDCETDLQILGLSNGREIAYDRLLLATGTQPRRCKALDSAAPSVHYLRCIEDAHRLRQALRPGTRVLLVGGGIIGLEVAAAAIAHSCEVTVIEAADRLLARAIPNDVGRFLETKHRDRGVTFRYGVTPHAYRDGGVELSDGSWIATDVIVVGIGVEMRAENVALFGFHQCQGIQVDASGATEIENVYAAGDTALQFSRWHDRWLRIETWANAQHQAIATAKTIAGQPSDYCGPPWFWSDQYDINLQVVGDGVGDEIVRRGSTHDGRFSFISLRGGEIVGGATINYPREMAAIRRLVAAGVKIAKSDLENPAFDLKRAISN